MNKCTDIYTVIIKNLPYISIAWDFTKYISSTIVGGAVVYFYNNKLNKKAGKNKAYIAAILIRFKLMQQISYLVNLEKYLQFKIKLIPSLRKINNENYNEQLRTNLILVSQDFQFQNDFESSNDLMKECLSQKKLYTDTIENILQFLTISENSFAEALEIKLPFNLLKQEFLSDSNNFSNDKIELFILSLEKHIPDWLEIVTKVKERISVVFSHFQKHICLPLKIHEVGLSEDPVLIDNLIKGIKE